PAMDLDMYAHPSTQENIATLRKRNNHIIEATSGQLASGLEGKGRMEEPAIIAEILTTFFNQKQQLLGKKIVITAGPTYEKIDPVRFIGNYSSGKMGYAIAEECAEQGANVILISGPVERNPQHANITKIAVESASEMSLVTKEYFPSSDVAILSAAVADFTPTRLSDKKIKREKESLTMELLPTEDIAASLGKMKKESQRIVGFALETTNEKAHAFEKLQRKNLDFIVLNSLNDKQAGFGYDTNKISIIDTQNVCVDYDLKTKQAVAKDIVEKLITILP
ncbi:MAG: bifunctional phosphopantothenoylcysteine decarboxylase/phosphopantothenate--cysteine ligase CoaBC, partial [Paludibacteraceae bacterium]|nr:bifunctional phosphopantothenoylcysteine decarboxylase/phosphopantothenate--cysteine ligase CoaBC [Paludibacteraceae bacterium]